MTAIPKTFSQKEIWLGRLLGTIGCAAAACLTTSEAVARLVVFLVLLVPGLIWQAKVIRRQIKSRKA